MMLFCSLNLNFHTESLIYKKKHTHAYANKGYAFRSNEGHPEALINPMYSLLKEKRQRRNDFLISIVKTFDFDLKISDESKVITITLSINRNVFFLFH